MFCKNCGKEIKEGISFCPGCGTQVAAKRVETPPVVPVVNVPNSNFENKKGMNRVALVITCAVLVMALVIGAGILLVVSGKNPFVPMKEQVEMSMSSEEETQEVVETESATMESVVKESVEPLESEVVQSPEPIVEDMPIADNLLIVEAASEYILPQSNVRYLTMEDLEGLTMEECKLARNELYARHGRRFLDVKLQEYFDNCSWYYGTIEPDQFDESVFNEYEFANRDLIVQYEQEQGYR